MIVTMIAALAENRVIGSVHGGIPWNLPRDRDHFRAYTNGKWILLGRRTYGEMIGWFTNQTPLILTRDPAFIPEHPAHRPFTSAAAAIDLARQNGVSELVVCGGAGVYAALIGFTERLVVTRIGDQFDLPDPVFFPDFETSGEWRMEYAETWPSDAENLPEMRLEIYRREGRVAPSP